jgi:transcriptional regulator with XRE-family HTH domain
MAERAASSAAYRAELERLALSEAIAREVIRLRMQRGLSQAAFGRLVGTPASVISRLERGDHEPSTATLRKIAQATGTRPVFHFAQPRRRVAMSGRPANGAIASQARPAESPVLAGVR